MNYRTAIAIAPVLLALAATPAGAVSLNFEQISWLDSTGAGYVSQYSDWGQVGLMLSSSDHGSFNSTTVGGRGAGYVGYVNIVTDASGTNDWNIQNLPIFYTDPSELDGRLLQNVWFDLGVSPGTSVTNLNCYYTIDTSPLSSMPLIGTTSSETVSEVARLAAGTRLYLGPSMLASGGMAAPPPANNFAGAAPGESVAHVGAIKPPENGVAAVDEDDDACAPGSAARSIQYLADQHPEVTAPGTTQQMYTGLYGKMKTNTSVIGTTVDDFLQGKIDYCVANGLPIISAQTSSFTAASDELNRNGDVELGVSWGTNAAGQSLGGHATMVTEIQELQDASGNVTGFVVKAVDDPVQGDNTAANSTHTYKFDAAGNLVQFDGGAPPGVGGKLITFQVQDVRKLVDPLEFRWGGVGILPMNPGEGLPHPVPVHVDSGPKIGGTCVSYGGTLDSCNPGNFVSSRLIANPRNEPDSCATLELDLASVAFTPVDPSVSTILDVNFSLGHVMNDDITAGQFMPILSNDGEVILENFIMTGSFFDVTYQVHLTGEDPQVYRLHGSVPEELLGKAWIISEDVIDPEAWIESFFDVSFELELTPEGYDAYALMGPDATLLNMELHALQVPEPATISLLALGALALLCRSRRRQSH